MALARVAAVARRTGRAMIRQPRLVAWSMLGVIAAAVIAGAALIAAQNLDRWAAAWRGGATLVVYLEAGAAPERGRAIAGELGAIAGVTRAEYVDPAEAARRLRTALGTDDRLLDGIEPTAMPATIELVLEPGARDVVAASPMFAALQGADQVDSVELVGEWDDRIGALLGGLRDGAWTLAWVLGALAAAAAAAVLRLRLAHRADELRVARLLGAGPLYAVGPAILAGAALGAIGAALALPVLAYLGDRLGPAIAGDVLRAIGGGELAFLSPLGIAVIVAGGAAIGAVAGALAETRAAAYGA
jgi:cell division protein FtsX